MKLLKCLLISVTILFSSINFSCADELDCEIECSEMVYNSPLRGGWFPFEPYQFQKFSINERQVLTGMDMQFIKAISNNIGVKFKFDRVDWSDLIQYVQEGKKDFASGATYDESRAEYVYYSDAYRFEEDAIFMLKDNDKNLDFGSIPELLAQIRLQGFKLSVIDGFINSTPQINLFLNDPANKDIVIKFADEKASLDAMLNGDVDGVLCDRIVATSEILDRNAMSKIRSVNLKIKTPIHFIFSKKTVPIEIVEKFNNEIKNFHKTDKYKQINKAYLYPVMLMQILDSNWFYFLGVIGTLGFAISGIAIASRENATLFGTFLFAMLPSVSGSIMRDVIVNRDEVIILLTPSYMYYILAIVFVGFSTVRLLEFYNQETDKDEYMKKLWDNVLVIGDAVGQSTFIVIGVIVTIMARIDPIELWGPFFAFLTANAGGIIRDLLRKKHYIICLNGALNAEISIIWGLILSVYLNYNSYDPDPEEIMTLAIIVPIGAFLTRIICYYFNFPNIKFRNDTVIRELEPLDEDLEESLDENLEESLDEEFK